MLSQEQQARNTLWSLLHATLMNVDEIRAGFIGTFPQFADKFDEWVSEFID